MPIHVTVYKHSEILMKDKMFMAWMHTRKQTILEEYPYQNNQQCLSLGNGIRNVYIFCF